MKYSWYKCRRMEYGATTHWFWVFTDKAQTELVNSLWVIAIRYRPSKVPKKVKREFLDQLRRAELIILEKRRAIEGNICQ